MYKSIILVSVATAVLTTLALPSRLQAERLGSTTSDAPNLVGEYVVHNPTDATIRYEVKWGKKNEWKLYELPAHRERKHTHAMNGDRAPTPYLRFDHLGGDGKTSFREYELEFGKVGYAGYGPKGNINEAIHYEFKYAADHHHLDLTKR